MRGMAACLSSVGCSKALSWAIGQARPKLANGPGIWRIPMGPSQLASLGRLHHGRMLVAFRAEDGGIPASREMVEGSSLISLAVDPKSCSSDAKWTERRAVILEQRDA